jgi:hypothetical protein
MLRTSLFLSLLMTTSLISAASAQRRPPTPPPAPTVLSGEMDALLADLVVIERQMSKLQGSVRNIKRINERIGKMRHRIRRVRAMRPTPNTPPQVVMQVGNPAPIVIVHQQPARPAQPVAPPVPTEPPPPEAMPETDFGRLLSAVNSESFSDGKTSVIRTAATSHFFSIDQTARLVTSMSFSKDKVAVVRILANRIVDIENAYQLYEAFTYSSDKRKVRQILGQ